MLFFRFVNFHFFEITTLCQPICTSCSLTPGLIYNNFDHMRSLDEFFTQEGKVVFIKTKKALSLKGSVKMHCLAGGILF